MPRDVTIARAAAGLVAAASLALVAGCGDAGTPDARRPTPADEVRVGVLFDIGGRGDGGFNDGAAAGAERARASGGVTVEYAEAGEGGGRAEALRALARSGPDAIVAIGFLASHDATVVAREFPAVHFTVIDYALPMDASGHAMEAPPNLAGINFREEEGSYLVGAIAASTSRSRVIGFVGGMDSPLIRKFEAGFEAGVGRTCGDCVVRTRYVGTTPAAFNDPAAGRRAAAALIAGGADVVFHAAGGTGAGVIAAARDAGRYAIGVDVDQRAVAPGTVLTSMVKRIDVAVHEAIDRERRGAFAPGITSLGLAEGGVGYVLDDANRALVSARAQDRAETLRAAVVAGLLTVPSVR